MIFFFESDEFIYDHNHDVICRAGTLQFGNCRVIGYLKSAKHQSARITDNFVNPKKEKITCGRSKAL